jgi:hypothetical protein
MITYDRWSRTKGKAAALVALALTTLWPGGVTAQPTNPHHGFLGGPWEIVVKMGHEGDTLRLPLPIADENKPQKIDKVLPVMGTPIKVKIEQYSPNLRWETVAVKDPNGGAVARLSLRGANLQQDLWLSARDVERQSISAHIGAVAIRELPGGDGQADVLQALTDAKAVGVLLVWLSAAGPPLQYAVKPGMSVSLPAAPWKLSVLQYVPHYSVDRETKEVTNLSDQPVNPALEIRVEGNGDEYQQWVWSKFPSSPHMRLQLPFRVKFVDFHLGSEPGQYILAAAPGWEPRMLYVKDRRKRIEPIELGKRYPFSDTSYSFAVEEVQHAARIESRWKTDSEMLLHPAVVASIVQGEVREQVVLELNKPNHHQTEFGTLVMFYRRVP